MVNDQQDINFYAVLKTLKIEFQAWMIKPQNLSLLDKHPKLSIAREGKTHLQVFSCRLAYINKRE